MNANQYQCARCKGIFDKDRSDEESLAEAEAIFGKMPPEEVAQVCDDCYAAIDPAKHPRLVAITREHLKRLMERRQ